MNTSREQCAHVCHKGGLGCDSINSTAFLAGKIVKETRRQFWVISSLRQQPKHCLLFCGVKMDPWHTTCQGDRNNTGKSRHTLCNPLLPPFDSESLYISLLTWMGPKGKFDGSRRWKKMGFCLFKKNSFIALAIWGFENRSMVGK